MKKKLTFDKSDDTNIRNIFQTPADKRVNVKEYELTNTVEIIPKTFRWQYLINAK